MADLEATFDTIKAKGFKVIMLSETAENGWLCTLGRSRVAPMNTWKTGRGKTIQGACEKAMGFHASAEKKPAPPPPTGFEDLI